MIIGYSETLKLRNIDINSDLQLFTHERGKGVFISTPKNGWYGKTEYKNSGKMTASAMKAAFSKFSNNVYISEDCMGKECLSIISTEEYAYYVETEILHWEDRATKWSGMPDRIEIRISIYDSRLKAEIASVVIDGKSKWTTLGGDHCCPNQSINTCNYYTRVFLTPSIFLNENLRSTVSAYPVRNG